MALVHSKKENGIPNISDDFLNDGKQFCKIQKISRNKKSGPYTKTEKEKRLQDVCILHFDYGYSARQISEIRPYHRNTINGDIAHLSSKMFDPDAYNYPELYLDTFFERLKIQRTRIRENLDKTSDPKEKMILERFITYLDIQIVNIWFRGANFSQRVSQQLVHSANKFMESHKHSERYLLNDELTKVSQKSYKKITKIIKDDRKNSLQNNATKDHAN